MPSIVAVGRWYQPSKYDCSSCYNTTVTDYKGFINFLFPYVQYVKEKTSQIAAIMPKIATRMIYWFVQIDSLKTAELAY